jgi:hypothetical protein
VRSVAAEKGTIVITTCLKRLAAGTAVAALFLTVAPAQEGQKPADDKVAIKLQVEKGKPLYFKSTTNNDTDIEAGGQTMSVKSSVAQELSLMPVAVKEDGETEFEVKVTRVTGSFEMPMMGDLSFDSNNVDEEDESLAMIGGAKMFTAIVDKKCRLVVSSNGRFSKFEAIDKVDAPEGPMGQMGTDPVRDLESSLKALFEIMPAAAKAVGETWDDTVANKAMNFKLNVKVKSALEKASADEVAVTSNGKIDQSSFAIDELTGDAETLKAMIEKMSIDDGSFVRKARLSRKDGLPLSVEITSTGTITTQSEMAEGDITMGTSLKATIARTDAPAPTSKPAKPAEVPASKPAEK